MNRLDDPPSLIKGRKASFIGMNGMKIIVRNFYFYFFFAVKKFFFYIYVCIFFRWTRNRRSAANPLPGRTGICPVPGKSQLPEL